MGKGAFFDSMRDGGSAEPPVVLREELGIGVGRNFSEEKINEHRIGTSCPRFEKA